MTITQLVEMAERIHDDEGYQLGSASTREYRNAYWARVIGCAYHGHPKYNPVPDKQWHLKQADASRPQTDDVATSMPSRNYWDCINGVGSDGYTFGISGHDQPLSREQIVFPPPVPAGSAPSPSPVPPPTPAPCVFPPRDQGLAFFTALNAKYQAKGYTPTQYFVNAEGTSVWYAEYLRHRTTGLDHAQAQAQVFADIDKIWNP